MRPIFAYGGYSSLNPNTNHKQHHSMSTKQKKNKKNAFLNFRKPWKFDNKRDKVGFSRTSIQLPPIVEQACTFLEQYGTRLFFAISKTIKS